MRLQGFKCDRCGKVVTDQDYCKLGHSEVGEEFLDDFPELAEAELCDDCYEEFRYAMRNFIASYMNYFGSKHIIGTDDDEHIFTFKEDDEGTHVVEVL